MKIRGMVRIPGRIEETRSIHNFSMTPDLCEEVIFEGGNGHIIIKHT